MNKVIKEDNKEDNNDDSYGENQIDVSKKDSESD